MIAKNQIELAESKILELFVNTVSQGNQSKSLSPKGIFSCGQHLNSNSIQRGLHGTAAAIRVLASSTREDDIKLVNGLIKYVHNITEIEKQKDSFSTSINNTIKSAEILYSLGCLPPGVADKTSQTGKLRNLLTENFLNHIVSGKGWSFFTGSLETEPHILPTAFVVLALAKIGRIESTRTATSYLLEMLRKKVHEEPIDNLSRADFSILIFVLFALVFTQERIEEKNKKNYTQTFKKLWASGFNDLGTDFEQNIGFSYNETHYYLRIPWQLYLMALASKLSPRHFASFELQKRIDSLLININKNSGFVYSHSEQEISSRTYAIVFDVLNKIERNMTNYFLYFFYLYIDRIRKALSSRRIMNTLAFLSLVTVSLSVYQWIKSDSSFSELAPEFIGFVLLGLLNFRKR